MMNLRVIARLLLVTVVLAYSSVHAFAPTNFFPPYDPALRLPTADDGDPFRIGVNIEYGDSDTGRNWDGKKANVLKLYEETQATIPMLMGAVGKPGAGLLLNYLSNVFGGHPLDDGTRGHIKFDGDFRQLDATVHGRYILPFNAFPGKLALGVSLPIRYASVDDIKFDDQTKEIYNVDLDVRRLLTNIDMLKGMYRSSLDLPDLNSWSKTGLGDLVILLEWMKDYPQKKENLKNVGLYAKLGLSCPTGSEKDEDKAFSLALGNDGAWGLPFGIGLDVEFDYHIKIGAEAEFLVLFDETKTRRLKTEEHQTSFLMLNKGEASKDHGLSWKFYLYLQGYHVWKGLSAKVAYEYLKHDDDSLTPKSDGFNSSIVNTARWLDEYYSHNIIFQLNYDFFEDCETWAVKPQLSLFYRLPVAGQGMIMPHTFGGQFAINF